MALNHVREEEDDDWKKKIVKKNQKNDLNTGIWSGL